jgi:hypothetical protein
VSEGRPVEAGAAVDREAVYYQAIEEFFVSRRGDPLFLSNADWLLIREWRVTGLPLRVVLRGIADALDAHAHSWGRDRKVGSLRYCAAEVEVARERWERALAGEGSEGDMEPALDRIESALATAHGLGAESGATVERLRNELKERRHTAFASPLEWEAWLAASERALLEAVQREDGPEAVALLEAEIDAELAPYRQRMPERVARQIRQDAVSRRLLEAHGLTRFTLFQA